MDKVTTWVKYVEFKKESYPQGTSNQRKKKGRNQGEPGKREPRGRRSRRGDATKTKGKEGCEKEGRPTWQDFLRRGCRG